MDVEPFVNQIEEGEEPSSVRAGKSNVRYLIFTYNHNWYFWLLFPCLTELYFLIARLLSQGPCQHASEVIIIISIVLGSIQLTSLFNLWPTGAATGAGDAWGGFTAYFTNVFCMQTMLSISTWATLAFPENITTIILFSYVSLTLNWLFGLFVSHLPIQYILFSIDIFQLLPKIVDSHGNEHEQSYAELVSWFIKS